MEIVKPISHQGEPNCYLVTATNAATNAKVELYLDEKSIKAKDEVKITKKLRTKGVSLAEQELKIYFLVPQSLQSV